MADKSAQPPCPTLISDEMSDDEAKQTTMRKRYRSVCAELARLCRDRSPVRLIAVSKKVPITQIEALLECGHRHFGENRVQEAQEKWPSLRKRYQGIVLHLLGSLQTNKVAAAVQLFDALHVLDRPRLADRLAAEMQRQGRNLPCFVQVNIGEEPQKSGIAPEQIGEFVHYCRKNHRFTLEGLMVLPPQEGSAAQFFARTAELARRFELKRLSMGMSADYPIAIKHGATDIRLGTALFGPRLAAHAPRTARAPREA